jgi:hypothetical protein
MRISRSIFLTEDEFVYLQEEMKQIKQISSQYLIKHYDMFQENGGALFVVIELCTVS